MIYNNYFYVDPEDYDSADSDYVPLQKPKCPQNQLNVPHVLQPTKETATDMYYHIVSEAGETQLLPGAKTETWGYNQSLLGETIVLKAGKTIHFTYTNELPVLTTYHLHGLNVSGDVDGGCHTPLLPGKSHTVMFKVNQPASTCWLHAHPCPGTGQQVWHGLACAIVIIDKNEEKLPIPHNYGVNDLPIILQDRRFHANNQWNYRQDYNPDGVAGPTAMIDGTINPYFQVKTQKLRLRLLDGANRREWRLHFRINGDDMPFTQIAGDGSLLPHPVQMTKLMLTCAERAEIIVDFSKCPLKSKVQLMSDNVPIMEFRVGMFDKDPSKLPNTLINLPDPKINTDKIFKVILSGMDSSVAINGKKFDMQRIDSTAKVGDVCYWDVTNTNMKKGGMIHPFHMHGCQFRVVSRSSNNGKPYPNETGLKDTVAINPGETVRLKVQFTCPGVFMYHCHIIEHEDGGMMAQIKVIDPKHPNKKYKLMNMTTLVDDLAKEEHVKPENVWIGGMQSYKKMGMKM